MCHGKHELPNKGLKLHKIHEPIPIYIKSFENYFIEITYLFLLGRSL